MAKVNRKPSSVDMSGNVNIKKGKAGRPKGPDNETPRMRFKRLAGGRLIRVLQGLKGLRNITGNVSREDRDKVLKAGYYGSDEAWNFILETIERDFNRLKKSRANGGAIKVKQTMNIPD